MPEPEVTLNNITNNNPLGDDIGLTKYVESNPELVRLDSTDSASTQVGVRAESNVHKEKPVTTPGKVSVKVKNNNNDLLNPIFSKDASKRGNIPLRTGNDYLIRDKQIYDKENNIYSNPHGLNYANERLLKNSIESGDPTPTNVELNNLLRNDTQPRLEKQTSTVFDVIKTLNTYNDEYKKQLAIFEKNRDLNLEIAELTKTKGDLLKNKVKITEFQAPSLFKSDMVTNKEEIANHRVGIFKELINKKGVGFLIHKPAIDKAIDAVNAGVYKEEMNVLGYGKTLELAIDEHIKGTVGKDKTRSYQLESRLRSYPGQQNMELDKNSAVKAILDRYNKTTQQLEIDEHKSNLANLEQYLQEIKDIKYAKEHENDSWFETAKANATNLIESSDLVIDAFKPTWYKALTHAKDNVATTGEVNARDIFGTAAVDAIGSRLNALLTVGRNIVNTGFGVNSRIANKTGNYGNAYNKYLTVVNDILGDIALNIGRDVGNAVENAMMLTGAKGTSKDYIEKYGSDFYGTAKYNEIREARGVFKATTGFDKNIVAPASQMISSVAAFMIESYALTPLFKVVAAPIVKLGVGAGAVSTTMKGISGTAMDGLSYGLIGGGKWAPQVLTGFAGGYAEGMVVGDESFKNIYNDLVGTLGHDAAYAKAQEGSNIATAANTALIGLLNTYQLRHWFKGGIVPVIRTEMLASIKTKIAQGLTSEAATKATAIELFKKYGTTKSVKDIIKSVVVDGAGEMFEEMGVNTGSQLIAESYVGVKRYNENGTTQTAWETLSSWDNINQGIWGFIGGAGTNATMNAVKPIKSQIHKQNANGDFIYLDPNTNKETTNPIGKPVLQDVNYNGWSSERVLARQTIDGIMASHSADMYVIKGLESELEKVSKLEATDDNIALKNNIKNSIFNVGLLRQVQTGLSPYMMLQYEQIANLTSEDAIRLGYAENTQDTQYKVDAQNAINKIETLMNIRNDYQKKYGNNSDIFDNVVHAKIVLKLEEFLLDDELSNLNKNKEGFMSRVEDLKRKHGIDDTALSGLIDTQNKINEVLDRQKDLRARQIELATNQSKGRHPSINPATTTIKEELANLQVEIDNSNIELKRLKDEYGTIRTSILENHEVEYKGTKYTFKRLQDIYVSNVKELESIKEAQRGLIKEHYNLTTKLDENRSNLKLATDELKETKNELNSLGNSKSVPIEDRAALSALKVKIKRNIAKIENKIKKLEVKSVTLERQMAEYVRNNQDSVIKHNELTDEVKKIDFLLSLTESKINAVADKVNNFGSVLDNELNSYTTNNFNIGKLTNKKNLLKLNFDKIARYGKKGLTAAQTETLYREANDYRTAQLNTLWSLMIATSNGTVSSVLLSKDRVSSLLNKLNYTDYSKSSETEKQAIKQDLTRIEGLLVKADNAMFMEISEPMVVTIEERLTDLRKAPSDPIVDELISLLETYQNIIAVEKAKRDAIETEANAKLETKELLAKAIDAEQNLVLLLQTAVDQDVTILPEGWAKIRKVLVNLAKTNPDEFKLIIDKIKDNYDVLLERSKSSLQGDIFYDLKTLLSENTITAQNKIKYSTPIEFMNYLNSMTSAEFIDSEFSDLELFVEAFINEMVSSNAELEVLSQNNQVTPEVLHAFAFNINEHFELFKRELYNIMFKQVTDVYNALSANFDNNLQTELDTKLGVITLLENVKLIEDKINGLVFNVIGAMPTLDTHLTVDDISKYKTSIVNLLEPYLNELNHSLSRRAILLKNELTHDIQNLDNVIKEKRQIQILDSLMYSDIYEDIITQSEMIRFMEEPTINKELFENLDDNHVSIANDLFDVINTSLSLDQQVTDFKNIIDTLDSEFKEFALKVAISYLRFTPTNVPVSTTTPVITTNDTAFEFTLLKTYSSGKQIANVTDVITLTDHGNQIVNDLDKSPSGVYDLVLEGDNIKVKGTSFGILNSNSVRKHLQSIQDFDLHNLSTRKGNNTIKSEIRKYSKDHPNLNKVEVLQALSKQYEALLEKTIQLETQIKVDGFVKITLEINNNKILKIPTDTKWAINAIPTLAEMFGDDILELFKPNTADDKKIELFYRPKDSKTLVGIGTTRIAPITFNQDSIYLSSSIFGHNMTQQQIGLNNIIECEFKKFNDITSKDVIDTIQSLLNIKNDTFKSNEFYKIRDLFRVMRKTDDVITNDNYFQIDLQTGVFILNFNRVGGVSRQITFTNTNKGLTFKIDNKSANLADVISELKKERPINPNKPSPNYIENILPYLAPKALPFKTKKGYTYLMNESIVNASNNKTPNDIYITGKIIVPVGAIVTSLADSNTLFPLGGISTNKTVEVKTALDLAETQEILSNMIANPNGQIIWSYMDSGVTTLVSKYPDLFIDFTEHLHNKIKSIIDNIPLEEFKVMNSLVKYKELEADLQKYTKDGKLNIPINSTLFEVILNGYNNYYLDSNRWMSRLELEQSLLNELKVKAKADNKIIIITSSFQFAGDPSISLHLVYTDQTNLNRVQGKAYSVEGVERKLFNTDNDFNNFTNKRNNYSKGLYYELPGYIGELIEPLVPKIETDGVVDKNEISTVERIADTANTKIITLTLAQQQELTDYSFMLTQGVEVDEVMLLVEDLPFNAKEIEILQDLVMNDYDFMKDSVIKYQLLQYKNINIETYNNIVDHIEKKLNITFNKVALGNSVYGYNRNNKLYLNTDMISADTPIHEALGHPVISYIKEHNKDLYNSLVTWVEDNLNKGGNNGINLLYNKIKYASKVNNIKMTKVNLIEELLVNYLSRLLTNKTLKDLDSSVTEYNKTFDDLVQGYIDDSNLDLKLISSKINISQLANILHYNQNISRILESVIINQQKLNKDNSQLQPITLIKDGVSELFESNPADSYKQMLEDIKNEPITEYKELGSKQDIEGFKDFVQGKQFQKLTAEEKAKTIEQVTKEHRSITALKDLSAKLAWRIGGKVEFQNHPNVDWKGYNQGMKSVLNEAYMTPDTPFHEILAHPIIRAIKKSNPELYQSLLEEFETGRGKEVFEQVKRDYKYKDLNYIQKGQEVYLNNTLVTAFFNEKDAENYIKEKSKYTLEEQQEEAIVTLLGLMAADKLDAKKDAILISKLKELWKEISDFVKQLLLQDEIRIDELPITTTLNDLAEIMAYGNNKIILSGYKIEYSTPLGNKYDTLEEVNNEIRGLADTNVEVDLSGVEIDKELSKGELEKIKELQSQKKEKEDYFSSKKYQQDKDFELSKLNKQLDELKNKKVEFYSQEPFLDLEDKNKYGFQDFDYIRVESTYGRGNEYYKEILGENYEGYYIHGYNTSVGKPKKKILPISKEQAIKIWEKDESSKYEVEDRQNMYRLEDSIRYLKDDSEIKWEIKDLEQKIERVKNGEYSIEGFIQKNKEYEQSKEIIEQWKKENNIQYDPEEVYSRGQEFYHIHNAYSRNHVDTELWIQNLLETIQDKAKIGAKVEMSFATAPKGEVGKGLQHHNKKTKQTVYITSYPKSEDIKFVSQIDNYTSSFTDLTVDMIKSFTNQKNERVGIALTKSVPLENLHTIQPNLATAIDDVAHHNEIVIGLTPYNFRINYEEEVPYHLKKLIDNFNKILDDKYGKLVKPEINKIQVGERYNVFDTYEQKNIKSFATEKEAIHYLNDELPFEEYRYVVTSKQKIYGKQPTQTRENTTSIESVKSKIVSPKLNNWRIIPGPGGKYQNWAVEYMLDNNVDIEFFDTEQEAKDFIKSLQNKKIEEKEYTSQALTNLKVAALKEIARKYPRNLITSKVVPINPNMVDNSEIQYSKVGSKQDVNGFKKFVDKGNIKTITTQHRATAGREYEYPSSLQSIYNFKGYNFKDNGTIKNLDAYNKQELIKELRRVNLSTSNSYELKPIKGTNDYYIYNNGKRLLPELKTTTNNIIDVIKTIPNVKVKNELQEIINTDKIDLLNTKLATDVVAKTELIKADSKSNVGKQLSIIFKDMDGYTSNDDTYRC